jgi:class 3 adenylate cyclase
LVRIIADDDFPNAFTPEIFEQWLDAMVAVWGSGTFASVAAPSRSDGFGRDMGAKMERFALSRGAFKQVMQANAQIDIRPVLPLVAKPTLVLHRKHDALISIDHARYIVDHIAGARLIELEGQDHYICGGDALAIAREVQRFVATPEGVASPEADMTIERVLATVLFTDVVGSTETAARLGDQRWRDVLDHHDKLVRREVERYRGRVVKTTGDGALATFDGPARAVRSAEAIAEGVRRLGIEIRAGVHPGEVELRGDDVGGIGVHIGARVAGLATAGQVLVSRTVVDLVAGSGLEFSDAGVHTLKGVPGEWAVFAVNK